MAGAHRIQRRIQFAETDMAGVLHFSNYFRLMEEVEHDFFRSLGLSVVMSDPDGQISWPRVSAGCEYFAPARFEDELDLHLQITEITERSVSYEVEFRKGDERLALGRITKVCCRVTPTSFRSVPIPAYIRERLTLGGGAANA